MCPVLNDPKIARKLLLRAKPVIIAPNRKALLDSVLA